MSKKRKKTKRIHAKHRAKSNTKSKKAAKQLKKVNGRAVEPSPSARQDTEGTGSGGMVPSEGAYGPSKRSKQVDQQYLALAELTHKQVEMLRSGFDEVWTAYRVMLTLELTPQFVSRLEAQADRMGEQPLGYVYTLLKKKRAWEGF